MLMLLVCAGAYTYAINTAHIKEIIPKVLFTKIPHTPSYLLGYINYSGRSIPTIDLPSLIEETPSNNHMHTRIVLLHTQLAALPIFGLCAEKVIEMVEIAENSFEKPGVHSKHLPFFAGIANVKGVMVQLLDIEKLGAFFQQQAPDG